MPTRKEIEAARTPRGGWTRAQLASWGVPWPPPKGWRKRLANGGFGNGGVPAEEPHRPVAEIIAQIKRKTQGL